MQDIDRSYLSQPEVVRASRNWTCIRLATYEHEKEAKYLAGVFVGRSGQLENTVFAFMNPQATEYLINPGRGPRQLFRGPSDMAAEMDRLARQYRATNQSTAHELPKVESLRLALNIAACEGIPVIVVTSKQAEKRLARAAWARKNQGKAVYVLSQLEGEKQAYLLQPDKFGTKIEASQPLDPGIDATQLSNLLSGLQSGPKDHFQHVREGHSKGIRWETRVPVTDPQARY
jgi:hypothetical protein